MLELFLNSEMARGREQEVIGLGDASIVESRVKWLSDLLKSLEY